jgi:3-mercaptopyruvate sulfurtransferase SseA
MKRKNVSLYLLVSGGVLLIIAALILVSRSVPPTQTDNPSQISDSHEDETYPEIARVNLAESKTIFDAGTAIFLDVRDADSFAASHIPGAINIPTAELLSRWSELDKGQWYITYCT